MAGRCATALCLLLPLVEACNGTRAHSVTHTDPPPQRAPAGEPQLARNIIVFMGDGMGPEQLSTAHAYPHHRVRDRPGE